MNQTQPGSFQSIALDAIRPSTTNPRKHFDPAALEELTQSIREEKGVAVPILCRPIDVFAVHSKGTFVRYAVVKARKTVTMGAVNWPKDVDPRMRTFDAGTEEENEAAAQAWVEEANAANDGAEYEIVFGERRWMAAKAAGLTEIRAEVRDLSDDEAMSLQLIENLQRADLHAMEEAEGFQALMQTGATAEDVAKKAGKTTAHVQKLLKLLTLDAPAKALFAAGHLTLGHALLLARLTAADQDRAVRDLLRANHLPKKEDMVAYVNREIKSHANRNSRLISSTEGDLRYWIESHILLSLAKVPWSLGDALLVPEAGPCTTCPKRTGSNIALFADMTVKEDVCLDAACFGTKQKAAQASKLKVAADAGKPLLKLSTKSGHMKMEGEILPKTMLKHGQWIKASPGSCDHIQKGLLTEDPSRYSYDGLDKHKAGDVINVCANQACVVHKHQVEEPKPKPVPGAVKGVQASAEERAKAAATRRKAIEVRETAIRQEIYDAMLPKAMPTTMFKLSVGHLFGESVSSEAAEFTIGKLGLKVKRANAWDDAHQVAIKKHVIGLGQEELARVAFYLLAGDGLTINDYDEPDEADSRERLWDLAKVLGVDADAIVEKFAAREAAAEKLAKEQANAKPAGGTKVVQATKVSSTPAKKASKTASSGRPKSGTQVDGKSAGAGEQAEAGVAR